MLNMIFRAKIIDHLSNQRCCSGRRFVDGYQPYQCRFRSHDENLFQAISEIKAYREISSCSVARFILRKSNKSQCCVFIPNLVRCLVALVVILSGHEYIV